MPSKVQLIGGQFQDNEGNLLVLGYLRLRLSSDENVVGVGQIAAGIVTQINLNSSGSVDTSAPQLVWGNDQMTPLNSFYVVTGYTAAGQLAWGPNNEQVTGSGGTFDVGTWIPNTVISWTYPAQRGPTGPAGVTGSSASFPSTTSSLTGFGNWSGFRTIPNGGNSLGGAFYGTAAGAPTTGTTPLLQINATATDTNYCSISSTAVISTVGGYNATSSLLGPTLGGVLSYQTRVQLQQTTQIRTWTGFVDSNNAIVQNMSATNPVQNIVGFRYDTTAGDTGWRGYCSTDATHFTTTANGPAMDTLGHSLVFLVSGNGMSITFYVDGVAIGTISTNIPTAATHLSLFGTVDNVGVAQARLMNVAYAVLMDKF